MVSGPPGTARGGTWEDEVSSRKSPEVGKLGVWKLLVMYFLGGNIFFSRPPEAHDLIFWRLCLFYQFLAIALYNPPKPLHTWFF